MELSEQLAYDLLTKFVQTYLECDRISFGKLTGLPIVQPKCNVDGTPLLLVNGKSEKWIFFDYKHLKYDYDYSWKCVLEKCLGQRISWFDSYPTLGKSTYMPSTIEELMIRLELDSND